MLLNKKNKSCLVIAFICLTVPLYCQDIKTDIRAINKTYINSENLSLTFELNMFENYQSQTVYYTQRGLMQKHGKTSFQKFEASECLNTPEYSIMLDKDEKQIVYAPKKTDPNYNSAAMALNLDTVLRACKAQQFKKISDKLYSYNFTMPDNYPDYRQITFYFDPATHLVHKIIFYCEEDDISTGNEKEKNSKARIEINYKDIDVKPALNNADFSYEKYLLKSGSTFKLKPELKNYHLTVLSF